PNYKEYIRSEKLIFKHQSPNDNLIVNYDNEETIKIKKEYIWIIFIPFFSLSFLT
ncbi:unnamed protein product, partial [marine sediment metagenome]